jgi:hypothetical protein
MHLTAFVCTALLESDDTRRVISTASLKAKCNAVYPSLNAATTTITLSSHPCHPSPRIRVYNSVATCSLRTFWIHVPRKFVLFLVSVLSLNANFLFTTVGRQLIGSSCEGRPPGGAVGRVVKVTAPLFSPLASGCVQYGCKTTMPNCMKLLETPR